MTARFLDIAEIEFDEAIRWYDAQALGLGDAFLVEVQPPFIASRSIQGLGICWVMAFGVVDSPGSRTD